MKRKSSVKIVLCGIFAAFTAICAMISIPFGLVPMNLAHVAIFISAWILGPVWAAASQIIYVVIGMIGLPVFSNFSAGVGHILGPTGGYILAYPLVAYAAGLVFNSKKIKGGKGIVLGLILGWVIEYVVGTLYYSVVTSVSVWAATVVCVLPFIIGDVCKSVAVFFICKKIKLQRLLTN